MKPGIFTLNMEPGHVFSKQSQGQNQIKSTLDFQSISMVINNFLDLIVIVKSNQVVSV